jgi:hypothetical protein
MTRRLVAARVGVGVMVAFGAVVLGNSVMAARARAAGSAAAAGPRDSVRSESFAVAQAGAAEPAKGAAADAAAGSTTAPAPQVAAGRTPLADGVFVDRSGDSVTVRFDTPVHRTRRHDKFDHVVRMSLPAVYGALADSAIAAVPAGGIGSGSELLTELPRTGVSLPAHDGWVITLWPGTRPGQDGPLVVSYRVTVARAR